MKKILLILMLAVSAQTMIASGTAKAQPTWGQMCCTRLHKLGVISAIAGMAALYFSYKEDPTNQGIIKVDQNMNNIGLGLMVAGIIFSVLPESEDSKEIY